MTLPIQLLSTDFDGTIHSEFENPPVSPMLVRKIRELQEQGAKWVINTGRDLSSLMEVMGRAHLPIKPDYVIVVEREIYQHDQSQYVILEPWGEECRRKHDELFIRVGPDLPRLVSWINDRFEATIYADAYSPFCLIAGSIDDTDEIEAYLNDYCQGVPSLTVVRNDVYARFSHVHYNKGTALAEVARQLGVIPANILAAGDHYNDLPMLSREYAHRLVAPANAIDVVKQKVREQGGYISNQPCGHGVLRGIEAMLEQQWPQ
ncbi:MAG TPA: HAD family hydrolase [Verrucomicrobiae bacterium]|nr:HAD family hydrolase [Verrucomicrobiae bacterium]